MLVLPIKRKWFDMIRSGQKKEEYREVKEYWTKRLLKCDIPLKRTIIMYEMRNQGCSFYKTVKFRNGYGDDKPTITCEVRISIGTGKEEWGAEPNKEYYILEILEILEVK